MKIVECVPNFSEGRDKNVISAITKEIESVCDVKLLDVDPGYDTNRTVVTFVGTPVGVAEAAFLAIKKASELIDMSKHKGAHPRMGATDVCPFVPVSGVTMDECVKIANDVAKRVADELNIPVYLYDYAAKSSQRRCLADVRQGEYEGLPEKIVKPEWLPDYGSAEFNARSGATIIGAREFLIAYNVNLNTKDRKLAQNIALNIREAGRVKRDDSGNIVKDADGNPVKQPGTLKNTRAVGWYIDEYGIAQISVNLINYKETPFYSVYEECRRQADLNGLLVTGSELVGMIPKDAVLEAGRYYLEKQGKSPGVSEEELVFTAVKSMGLSEIAKFEPDKKIIEYAFACNKAMLTDLSVKNFVNTVAQDLPAPGGGSVAALCGSLGAALAAMVANLTYGKKGYEAVSDDLKNIALKSQQIKQELLLLVDSDTEAFNQVMEALKLPSKTEAQSELKNKALQAAYKSAASVPLRVFELACDLLPLIDEVSRKGNSASVTDAGVAAACVLSSIHGAVMNIKINILNITDSEFVEKVKAIIIEKVSISEKMVENIKNYVDQQIS